MTDRHTLAIQAAKHERELAAQAAVIRRLDDTLDRLIGEHRSMRARLAEYEAFDRWAKGDWRAAVDQAKAER